MKLKYLGRYEIDNSLLLHEKEEDNTLPLVAFEILKDSLFDAQMPETNTSALVLKLDYRCNGGKVWRIY